MHNTQALFSRVNTLFSERPCIRLGEVSERLGVDRHTVEKVVHTLAGVSFREYRNQQLLTVSIHLIEHSDFSFKEIAVSLGYSAFDSFARFVKTHSGQTPRQIRLKFRPKPQMQHLPPIQ